MTDAATGGVTRPPHRPQRRSVGVAGSAPLRPTSLTVLYDAGCPVCRRARRWVERQRQLLPVRFVTAGSPAARRRFPAMDEGGTLTDVTVITDKGAVLRGDQAWIAVLWAVARTRPTALRLADGRHRWSFNSVKGATEAIRRLSAGQSDNGPQATETAWPPPVVDGLGSDRV